jgi:threonine dehydrogenase-like Zn-dependent dehydrogenase
MKSRFFYFDNGTYDQGEEDVASPAEDEVLVRTTKSLVSVGTETHCNTGRIGWKQGRHGYSNAGVVIKAGARVEDYRTGDRLVSLKPHVDYYVGKPDRFLPYRIPDDVSDLEATFCVLAIVALHAVERARIGVGQPVVVVGQGTVGQLAAQLARIAGAATVTGVDLDESRLELSKKMGVDDGILPDGETLEKALKTDLKHAPPPIFVEACGEVSALRWMMGVAPLGSKIVLTGSFMEEVAIFPEHIVNKELVIIGSHQPKDSEVPFLYYPYNRPFNFTFVMDLIRRGRLKVKEMVSGLIKPEALLAFYDAARDGSPHLAQPVIDWEK